MRPAIYRAHSASRAAEGAAIRKGWREHGTGGQPLIRRSLIHSDDARGAVRRGGEWRANGERAAVRAQIETFALPFGLISSAAEMRLARRAFELGGEIPVPSSPLRGRRKRCWRDSASRRCPNLPYRGSARRRGPPGRWPSSLRRTPQPNQSLLCGAGAVTACCSAHAPACFLNTYTAPAAGLRRAFRIH